MTLEEVRALLGWCTLINLGVLAVWGLGLLAARDRVFRLQGRMFSLEPTKVASLHFRVMAYFKMGVILLNLTPYLALRIIG